MKVFVGNFHESTVEDDLKSLFSQVGELIAVTIVKDKNTGRSRGFGFIEFESRKDGHSAISKFDDHVLNGEKLKVDAAKERSSKGPFRKNRW